ncbi:hypothetical protein P10VF_202 [Rhizobium phage vB_RleM_P10VF]|uniref:Uncharacterized protein n=1 Tax=Rhizobium phage vB_RleM_P10VF TaxID=1527770 RepID=A0A076YM00_9CAUD|nr:hypothetical protein P10VF_202 [Rhizobium phage vB_RleM_P10VF]AIK68415.1 hypothetical protein P10VF_202 [Rhizobium phage vB_RleM_P10VF]
MGLTNLEKVIVQRDDHYVWWDENGDESGPVETKEKATAMVLQYVEYLNGNLRGPEEEITDSIIASLNIAKADDHIEMNKLYSHPIAKDFYDFSLFLESLPGSTEMTDLQNRFQELRRKTEMHMNYALRMIG